MLERPGSPRAIFWWGQINKNKVFRFSRYFSDSTSPDVRYTAHNGSLLEALSTTIETKTCRTPNLVVPTPTTTKLMSLPQGTRSLVLNRAVEVLASEDGIDTMWFVVESSQDTEVAFWLQRSEVASDALGRTTYALFFEVQLPAAVIAERLAAAAHFQNR